MNVLVFLNEGIYKFVKSALVNANKTLGVSYTYQILVLHNLENKRPALDLCVCVFLILLCELQSCTIWVYFYVSASRCPRQLQSSSSIVCRTQEKTPCWLESPQAATLSENHALVP